MAFSVELSASPSQADRQAIADALDAFNDEASGDPTSAPTLALLIRAEGGGPVLGGLWGRSYWGWLFIELLFVPGDMRGRGVGRDLMRQAEAEAARRGCHGVWLDTFSFQARGFYERQGYAVLGRIDDYPPGHTRFFLQKRF